MSVGIALSISIPVSIAAVIMWVFYMDHKSEKLKVEAYRIQEESKAKPQEWVTETVTTKEDKA